MSKRQFKSQASSGRAGDGFGGFGGSGFGSTQSSILSYIQEPPDYAAIGDAAVVVDFKNLLKRDDTTKAKALEELQGHLSAPDLDIEDGMLEAWVKLFPRLSIDNSRRVRQLSHTLNGQICVRCGKRTAKHLSRIAGPWLAGSYDNDKAVARAAREALSTVFPSTAKEQGLKKTFHLAILEYCRDAVLLETAQTLSDSRVVSIEDAEATYSRVVATSLALITALLETFPAAELESRKDIYDELLDGKIWEFVVARDANVRRTMHRFVRAYLAKFPQTVEGRLKDVSTAYVNKGLPSDQMGSTLEFLGTLSVLTTTYHHLWTEAYHAKKPPVSRLRSFLKNGSQGSSSDFWQLLQSFVRKLPAEVLPKSLEESTDLLSAAREGVSRKEERFNASDAWQTYIILADIVISQLPEEDRQKASEEHVFPLVRHYLHPSQDTAVWNIAAARPAGIISKTARLDFVPKVFEQELPALAHQLIELIKLSLPEQSKDHDRSQKEIASRGERWASIQRELFQGKSENLLSLRTSFLSQDAKLVEECFDLLRLRNGKPYGAAAVVDVLLRDCSADLLQQGELQAIITTFAQQDLPALLFTPSQKFLTHMLYACASDSQFSVIFSSVIDHVINSDQSAESKGECLRTLLTRQTPEAAKAMVREREDVQRLVVDVSVPNTDGKVLQPALLGHLLSTDTITPATSQSIVKILVDALSVSSLALLSLESLDHLSASHASTIRDFRNTTTDLDSHLLSNLVRLEQDPRDNVAELASSLSARLSLAEGGSGSSDRFAVIRQDLENAQTSSLSIESIHALTDRLLGTERILEDAKIAMPNPEVWLSALEAALTVPQASLSLLSPLGGTVSLIKRSSVPPKKILHDAEGYSQALRIAMFAARLVMTTNLTELLQSSDNYSSVQLLMLLATTISVAEDNMSISGGNSLWRPSVTSDTDVLGFISEANRAITKLSSRISTRDCVSLRQTVNFEKPGSNDAQSALSYYSALAAARTVANLSETHGSTSEQSKASEEELQKLRRSGDTFALLSHIYGHQQALSGGQTLSRLCNELVADLTGADVSSNEAQTVQWLITLNTILGCSEDIGSTIAKQRLIFLVKRIIPWLGLSTTPLVQAEVARTLTALLPYMDDIYGEHWSQILSSVLQYWHSSSAEPLNEESIVLRHVTLRLYSVMRKLSKSDEPNDDLIDTLKEKYSEISAGLLDLLKSESGRSDDTHQPLMVTNELLGRLVAQSSYGSISDAEDLFPLLYTPSRSIQQAAFDLLHKHIPAAQEQISFDAALENRTAHLPDELLSLILEAPTLDSLVDETFERGMPLSLQGYLYSWRLLFDHFDGSSYKVKSDYIEQLKDGLYMPGLLSFTFDFLGHTRGKPIDASKFDVVEYQSGVEADVGKEVQWLLAHLYYLALTYTPGLVKSYYLDIRSRQVSQAVEGWTAKYISPLIINATLQGVAEWSEKSVNEDPDYEKMTVKVGMRSKEINVSYLVDEQTMAIKVILPETYPLASAQVVGVSRVAVKEEKWQSWLRNCQGVITFSNGSISDGLSSWRKNVTGALKGQTECAICYSIISGDKQLPTKRCPTCKNLFHASCLYKWFKTSNASTCPLCRNAFNFN